MMRCFVPVVLLCLNAGLALAEAPAKSPRPINKPALSDAPLANAPAATPTVDAAEVVRPKSRPADAPVAAAPAPEVPAAEVPAADPSIAPAEAATPTDPQAAPTQPDATVTAGLARSPRPLARPKGLAAAAPSEEQVASAEPSPKETRKQKREKASKKGSVCGDPAIKGENLARVTSKVKGCGIEDPVRITSVSGIRLSQPATITCDTAQALKTWIETAMQPAFGNREVVQLHIAGHYVCRPRNNVKGAKISEHGRGKALDISGFVFADGKEWSIARDYNKQIRKAHKAACGIFGTTLGPGSDGYHEDHLHFDTASYRSGPYCR